MAGIDWTALQPDAAQALVSEWEDQRQSALDWLNDMAGDALPATTAGLRRAWSWYCQWSPDPSLGSSGPVWWLQEQNGASAGAAWGLDAISHLREATAHHYLTGLERSFDAQGPSLIRMNRHGDQRLAYLSTFEAVVKVSERGADELLSQSFQTNLERTLAGFRRGLESMAERIAIDEMEARGVRVGSGAPPEPGWLAAVADAVHSRKADASEWGLYEATLLGEEGEHLVVEAGRSNDQYKRKSAALAMRYLTGQSSLEALRDLIGVAGPGAEDLQGIAVTSLAHRLGEEAEDDLTAAFRHPKTRRYGRGLAVEYLGLWSSTDTLWDEIFTWQRKNLPTRLGNPRTPGQGSLYLLRHAAGNPLRGVRLVGLVRQNWELFTPREQSWFKEHWPDVQEIGVDPTMVVVPDLTAYVENRRDRMRGDTLPRPPFASTDPFATMRRRPRYLPDDE